MKAFLSTPQKITTTDIPEDKYQTVSTDEFERYIADRLSAMSEPYRMEFYRQRDQRKESPLLSARDIDMLILEALEQSYKRNGESG